MSEELETSKTVLNISRKSVNRAIELLQAASNKKRKRDPEDEKNRQIKNHCTNICSRKKRRKIPVMPFSKSIVLSELRSCLNRHDWQHMQILFPLLLSYDNELEPLIWRYALILHLYSPHSDASYLREFFDLCIGSQDTNVNDIAEKLLIL